MLFISRKSVVTCQRVKNRKVLRVKNLCRRNCSWKFNRGWQGGYCSHHLGAPVTGALLRRGIFLYVETRRDLCYYNIWGILSYLIEKISSCIGKNRNWNCICLLWFRVCFWQYIWLIKMFWITPCRFFRKRPAPYVWKSDL